jgi:[pyruvate, water dikinase]-phosphate phosphotransferase / [pyruvate, water dikinase] kinase
VEPPRGPYAPRVAETKTEGDARPELFLISDGTGETAAAAVRAAMSQFPGQWRLRTFGEVRHESQVRRIMERALEARALVVFTLVRESLSDAIEVFAGEHGVPTVNLLGAIISKMATHFQRTPEFRPGILHGFSDEYFQRVEAVEFAVRHDDGANLHTLFQADLVLTGVSRTSKTPLSMYLAQRGYKTGNVPLVPEIDPPRELLEIDRRKVIGLVVDAATLLGIRRERIRALRASPYLAYAEPEAVDQELVRARRLFRAQGWRTVDITGRAVEENAARILELLEQRAHA